MHIGQLAADVVVTATEVTSNHASTRLRALVPSRALIARGHTVSIFPDDRLDADAANGRLVKPDLMVVHKIRRDLLGHLRALKAAGRKVVLDICDHVIALPHLSDLYAGVLPMADAVSTPTAALAGVLSDHVSCPIHVIPDAVEGLRGAPWADSVQKDRQVRMLWFGRSQNLAPLIDRLSEITPGALGAAVVLEVMTNPGPSLDLLRSRVPESLEAEITPWTVDGLERALGRADLVLLPTDSDPSRLVKSANRLERALWSGRLPIAMPSPVAEDYRESAILTEDLGEGVRRALADPGAWKARITLGQERVAQTRTGAVLAPLWEAAFLKTL
ncbi:MAG: hypothetical protein NXI19_10495 [Alphaproteobacteria bacterium]|nr:hypothetical protein [Alphaproteobacteria bacterium]